MLIERSTPSMAAQFPADASVIWWLPAPTSDMNDGVFGVMLSLLTPSSSTVTFRDVPSSGARISIATLPDVARHPTENETRVVAPLSICRSDGLPSAAEQLATGLTSATR
jgi:hypothetical protein